VRENEISLRKWSGGSVHLRTFERTLTPADSTGSHMPCGQWWDSNFLRTGYLTPGLANNRFSHYHSLQSRDNHGAGVPEWPEFAFWAGAGAGVNILGWSRSRNRSQYSGLCRNQSKFLTDLNSEMMLVVVKQNAIN